METESYKLHIDGRWELTDLNVLSRVYIQIYGLLYSLESRDEYEDEEIQYIYSKYPWRGGYSAVNFYQNLFTKTPRPYRPKIKSIEYASPGFIELTLLVEVAKDIAVIVGSVSGAIMAGNKAYSSIQKGISDRKLTKINLRKEELDLVERELQFIRSSVKELAEVMGISNKMLKRLYVRTDNNDLAVLKILSSLYRRARDLAKLKNSDRLDLDG